MASIVQKNEEIVVPGSSAIHIPQVGDLLISYLEQIGVEYIFGIPGGAIEPLYNAIARSERRGGLRPIVARHETGAAFMADGYTRETGKLGVCCATTGPGATNLITGVASAYADNIPMLVITAQTSLNTFGKGAFQESSSSGVNIEGMFQYCTRYNSLVTHVEQMEGKLVAAIMTAFQSPRGPVHLSIPLDVLRAELTASGPSFDLQSLLRQGDLFGKQAVEELYENISRARNIVILVGSGCAEAIGAILEFALLINASIITTASGKGLVSSYHPKFKGVFGFAGHESAAALLSNESVDLVLAVGTGLGEWDSRGWDSRFLMNERLIHIDSNPEHLTHSPMARLHVWSKLRPLFEMLIKCHPDQTLIKLVNTGATKVFKAQVNTIVDEQVSIAPAAVMLGSEPEYFSDATPIKPQRLMHELSRRFPLNTRYLVDTGNSFAWSTHYLHPLDRRVSGSRPPSDGRVRTAMGFASMGWAIGGAVGTALGSPNVPIVCITGDGSFLMSGQEITVAVEEALTVIFVILNDGALGMVKHGQRLSGAEPIAYELPPVDFCAIAKALGSEAYTIRSPQDMAELDMHAICKRRGPTLLDVHIDCEEVPPIGMRIRILNNAQLRPFSSEPSPPSLVSQKRQRRNSQPLL